MRILTGKEILTLAERGEIVRSNFQPKHCETMFYNLTLGYLVQSVSKRDRSFVEINDDLVIGPGEVVNVELNERFNFNDTDGRPRYGGLIVSRARLLAAGISHPPTVVDPGSTRATYLTMVNHTNFPGPRMYAGQSKIAKMVVFAYEDGEELPESWEPTEPYEQVDEEEMPRLWPPQQESWRPVRKIDEDDLETLRERYGPPFDIIAVALSDVISQVNRVRADATESWRAFDTARTGIDYQQRHLEDIQRQVEAARRDERTEVRDRRSGVSAAVALLLCMMSLAVGIGITIWILR